MKITLANKTLEDKPPTKQARDAYFKGLIFRSIEIETSAMKEIISNGGTISYIYKDNIFRRKKGYMKNNYVGTQYICVDIDKSNISPTEFVEHVKYKPSILHTTFSNLTERKDYKYCFHLLYFFDGIIYGEDNFDSIFNLLTDDYENLVDKQARDCHRVMFTSNSSLPDYEYKDYGITYKVSDFINQDYNDIDNLFEVKHEDDNWDKISGADISNIFSNNILGKTDLSQDTTFILDKQFFNDMYSMKRSDFIYHYSSTYPYVTETYIDPSRYENGYVDLRHEDYYVVPTAQFRWDAERQKPYIPKIKEGSRTKMLWYDILCFMKIVPDVTREHLVYLAITEVYRNFENGDKQLDNMFIINKCKEVWNTIDDIKVKPVKKSFKIDKDYWLKRGMDNWLSITNYIRKQMKCEDFGNLYDYSLTIEQNIKEFKKFGVVTTPKTLKAWLDKNGIPYTTDKEVRDEYVQKLYEGNKNLSSRELEQLCKKQGIEVSYRTIQRILAHIQKLNQD